MNAGKNAPTPPELPASEWNFDAIPDRELVACCHWEYARESTFIRDVRQRCPDPRGRAMTNRELRAHCGGDLERIQSMGYAAEVFLRGFFFDEVEDARPKHPDAPWITGSFPRPWQDLSAEERTERSHIRDARTMLPLIPFQRAYPFEAKDVAQWVESQYGRLERAAGEVKASLRHVGGGEVALVRIEWGSFTNEELIRGFSRWVKDNRPGDVKAPDQRGHKAGDWRANLTRLAALRLLSRFTVRELVAEDACPAVWQTKQFGGKKWADPTKWRDARREAGALFRRLLPFLPRQDRPLSWKRTPKPAPKTS